MCCRNKAPEKVKSETELIFVSVADKNQLVHKSEQSVLGQVAFGKVHLVRMKKGIGDEYALKQLPLQKVQSEQIMDQVLVERDVMFSCGTHPYVIKLFSFWQTKESLNFFMEYSSGGDMFDHVRKNAKLPAEEAARYTFQMAQALDFLGEKKVIFRDLKLENVLINHEKQSILLADFGLAKQFSGKHQHRTTKTICGTIQYMAPEILKGEAYGREVFRTSQR